MRILTAVVLAGLEFAARAAEPPRIVFAGFNLINSSPGTDEVETGRKVLGASAIWSRTISITIGKTRYINEIGEKPMETAPVSHNVFVA